MANQVSVNSGSGAGAQQVIVDSNGNISVTVSRSVIGTVANVASANYANFAGEAFDVSGSNVTGAVANATFATTAGSATTAGTVTTAAQPNITSVGNLTSLNVTGTTTTGNLVVTGNLQVGNLVANSANYANFAGIAYSIDGANVNGAVANATFANDAANANIANIAYSVDVANVSGIGNIATINIDGNASNVLHGDGTFGPEGTTGNANYAAYAGNVTVNSQPNITSVGTLTGLTVNANLNANINTNNSSIFLNANETANLGTRAVIQHFAPWTNAQSSLGALSSGSIIYLANTAPGNVGFGNIRSYWNFDTNGNLVHIFGGTGNINAKGLTLGSGNVAAGRVVATGNVQGNVVTANYLFGEGGNISNIQGANVSGSVANATYANDAGNANIANVAYSVDAANVVGLGNIATINLDGNAANLLDGTGNWVAIPTDVANANYANYAGNAYSVDGANVVGDVAGANYANFAGTAYSVDGANVSNTVANANYAAYAGDITINAQPNITSVGTLTGLTINANSTINGNATNASVQFQATENANLGARTTLTTLNTVQSNLSSIIVNTTGMAMYIANTAPGNVGFGNIKSYWTFDTAGNLGHVIGGAGNINVKGLTTTGNIATGRVTATGNIQGNIVTANYLYGEGSNITNVNANTANTANTATRIQNGTSNVEFAGANGELLISTLGITNGVTVNGRFIYLNGANTGGGDISALNLINGALNWTLDNTQFSGGTPFGMNRIDDTGTMEPLNFQSSRGNIASIQDLQVGDPIYNERYQARANNSYATSYQNLVQVKSIDPNSNVAIDFIMDPANDRANSRLQLRFGEVDVNFGNININGNDGNITTIGNINIASGNIVLNANGDINAAGRLDYLRTFGSFTSNATQTSNGANTINYMTFNNTEDANGISIANNTEITVARTGRYNIQFSAQIEKTDSGSDVVEIWLVKNGNGVANTATQLTLAGNNTKEVAAWDFNVNAANVNDYFELAWASPDANVQLTAIDTANTISGIAVPSIILDINPIGA